MSDANPFQTPMAGGAAPTPSGPKPDNNLVLAILVTICCCLPFGIVGIIYATQVDSKWNAGDAQGAMAASQSARTWSLWGLGISLVGNVIGIVLYILAFMAAAAGAGAGAGGGF